MDGSETTAGSGGPEADPLRIRWAYVWLAWLGVAFLFIVQNVVGALAAGVPIDPQWAVAHEIIYWGLWAALTPVLLAWARRYPLGRDAGARPWLAHLGFALVVAPTQTFLTYTLHLLGLLTLGVVAPAGAGAWLEARRGAFLVISLTGFWKYAVVVGLYYAFDYYHRFRRGEREGDRLAVRAAELETRLAHARLDALRMQLHPHFLFNALNSIAVLNGEDPDRANRMLLRLSDLLRTVLETDGPEVSLGQELIMARQYLDIQRVRYEERLVVDLEVEREARSARVPAFLLQPLIENAIRHGVERGVTATRIRIAACTRNGQLRIEVENRIPAGTDGPRGRGVGRGIGLANTRERLRQAYGGAGRFQASAGADGTTFVVRIEVPFQPVAEK